MSVSVIPVADLLRDLVQQALAEDRKRADHIPVSQALRWFAEGYREIVKRTQFLQSTVQVALLATMQQTGPNDIMDRLIPCSDALWCEGEDGIWYPLVLRDWNYVRHAYGGKAMTGAPTDWAWDEMSDLGGIIIFPTPTAVAGRKLVFDYIQDPGLLSRLYDDDVALCSVTIWDPTVTFAASIAGRVAVDDVFGVKAAAEELPTSWYRVAVVTDTTHIELSEGYAGPTDASSLFTLSQVSPCEWKRPSLVRWAPVAFALKQYWTREDQARASFYEAAFEAEITRIATAAGERTGIKSLGRNFSTSFAGMRTRR